MSSNQELRELTPSYRVQVNGADLPEQATHDLATVNVLLDVAAPSMFTLRLTNWDADQRKFTWSDERLFALGNAVEVQMGYVDQLETLMVGEITGLEPEWTVNGTPMLTVRGYDRRHRLMRGHKTRTFRQVTDSDVASQLASAVGLQADTVDSKVRHPYVLQHNQTDLEFLQARARRIGYEVLMEDKKLIFRPPPITQSAALTLTYAGDVGDFLEFYLRLSSLNAVSEIAVHGWDVKTKEVIIAKASAGSERGTMDGAISGPAAVKDFGQYSAISVERPLSSQAEADQMAKGHFDAMALDYVSGEGVCVGRSDLRAGMVIKLDGLGQRYSGHYYVTEATHTYSAMRGYRTTFTVRRNAT